ncbi:MAG: type II secretion system protein [Phycisphaerae bacterium]|nr:type II secretion system protein [Phycisphaerae bacterium]
MKKRSGFTLVEILIVVVILGILAAIVIPQFSDASTEAKTSSLLSNLQTVRSQIQLYKIQHTDALPGAGGASFAAALTGQTDVAGAVGTDYGPYLQAIPKNPFNDLSTVTEGTTNPTEAGTTGWFFNTSTGEFLAVDSVAHLAM